MATAVVTIICIALIVLGGMTMSRGILISSDTTAFSVEDMSAREGAIMRTGVETLRAAHLAWADLLRLTVDNNGQTKLAGFNKWDLIVHYYGNDGKYYTRWLPYSEGVLADNKWQKARICLNGQLEFFEPGILNPEEELIILARLNPPPADGSIGEAVVATPNGIESSIPFYNPGYALLTPHSENTTIGTTNYYQMEEATPADDTAMTESTDIFQAGEIARKLMHNANDSARPARHVFTLTGISSIPSGIWTLYYRCGTEGFISIENSDINFNIDVLIRKADGTVRTTIATNVAKAYLTNIEVDSWVTKSAIYSFPGYTVVDDSDYLEIVYYGETYSTGPGAPGYMQLRIDDGSLAAADQTRIEA